MQHGESRPRVLVAPGEAIACLTTGHVISVIHLPDLMPIAEVGIEAGSEVRVLGEPPRLLVLTPAGVLHVVDPEASEGPIELAQLKLPPASKFLAVSGTHALFASSSGPVIANIVDDSPALLPFPSRGGAPPAIASAMKPGHFIVHVGGVLEEWNGHTRAPQRRFRLERPIAASHLGAGARFIWFVHREQPDLLVVLPLTGNIPPVRIELPEPAALAVGDAEALRVAIVGAESGGLFIATLMTRSVVPISRALTHDVAWRNSQELVRVTDTVLDLVSVPTSLNDSDAEVAPRVTRVTRPMAVEPLPPELASELDEPSAPSEPSHEAPPPAAVPVVPAHEPEVEAQPAIQPIPIHEAWRDAIATWTRSMLRGLRGKPPVIRGLLRDVCRRLGLDEAESRVVWFLYGARLCGTGGVAPVDLVDICPNGWGDVLGTSELARCGAFRYRSDRVRLSSELVAVLDEAPPLFGVATAGEATLTARVAIVARETDYAELGRRVAPELGALFAPSARGLRKPARFLFEARARGLAPIVPGAWLGERALPATPSVIVVDDEPAARAPSLPIVAPAERG